MTDKTILEEVLEIRICRSCGTVYDGKGSMCTGNKNCIKQKLVKIKVVPLSAIQKATETTAKEIFDELGLKRLILPEYQIQLLNELGMKDFVLGWKALIERLLEKEKQLKQKFVKGEGK